MATAASGATRVSRVPAQTSRGRLIADRVARLIVTTGGMLIIAGVLGILVFILVEVFPLALPARVAPGDLVSLSGPAAGALLGNESRTLVAALGGDGVARVYGARDGRL